MAEKPVLLTRRSAIKRSAAIIGSTLTATQLGLLNESLAAITEDSSPRFFDEDQFSMLMQIADLVIPETDTPGALGANVHHFIDLMLAEWASPQRQARYVAGLADIDGRAHESGGEGFYAGTAAQQVALLQVMDKEAFAQDAAGAFFRELKHMLLFAYYNSEPGGTLELNYLPIPGDYRPCVPMEDIGRAWFWNGYSYGL